MQKIQIKMRRARGPYEKDHVYVILADHARLLIMEGDAVLWYGVGPSEFKEEPKAGKKRKV